MKYDKYLCHNLQLTGNISNSVDIDHFAITEHLTRGFGECSFLLPEYVLYIYIYPNQYCFLYIIISFYFYYSLKKLCMRNNSMNDSSIRNLTLRMRMFGIGGKEIEYLDLAGIF